MARRNSAAMADFVESYCAERKRNVWSRPELGGARLIAERALCPACANAKTCDAFKRLRALTASLSVTAPIYECPDFQEDAEW
jgi:hypothetical protein